MPRKSRLKTAASEAASASVQDYLAAIYDLQSSRRPVIGARLAKHMAVSAPAVTEALHRLARSGYVKVGSGKEVTLTPRGREIAEVMALRREGFWSWDDYEAQVAPRVDDPHLRDALLEAEAELAAAQAHWDEIKVGLIGAAGATATDAVIDLTGDSPVIDAT